MESAAAMRFNLKSVMFAVIPYVALASMFWAKISQYPPDDGPYGEELILVGKVSFCVVFTLVWFIAAWHVPAVVSWLRRYL
jgi:hypothetical protein